MNHDLIKRQDAINALVEKGQSSKRYKLGELWELNLSEIKEALDALPSAEPERKKGEWSNYKDEHCCSICKCVVISNCWDDEIRYNYCPHCGADMRGE